MWVCMDPSVLYSSLIPFCLLWSQLQILHPSPENESWIFFFFRTTFFQTLVTLPLPRCVGSLYCYRCYSHHRTEPPFFLPCYTKLLLLSPNSICYFSSSSFFPLHLKCCCLYGAFRKQTSCSVILRITSDLWPVQGTRCDALCYAFESQLTDLEQICFYSCELQERSWLTFFVYKQPHFPTAVCSAVLGRVTFHL